MNVEDAWAQLTLEPLQESNDPRFVDCSVARGIDVAGMLHTSLILHSNSAQCAHLLVTGYRGDGKSTELFQFIHRIKNDYRPLYFNSEEEFDLNDFRFPDFLLGIAATVFRRMKEEKLELPSSLIEEVADWFSTIVETVERKTSAELKAEVTTGAMLPIPAWFSFITGKLVGTVKAGGEKRREVRKELDQRLEHLIYKVDKLLTKAVQVSKKKDGRELVIIFDNLDRLGHEAARDFFYDNGKKIKSLNCHFVYVIPISLLYEPDVGLMPFGGDNVIKMPMIPIKNKNGEPNETSITHLKGLLERRFVPEQIIVDSDKIMRNMILASGGHLRDLVRLFKQSCRDAIGRRDQKINEAITQRVVNSLCEGYQNAATEDDFTHLLHTYKTKDADNNDRTKRLIFHLLILVYDQDGITWKDVHPALAQGEKFQGLLREEKSNDH
jgi:hypothetical protein